MSKQLRITITVNDAERGFDTYDDVGEAMIEVFSWINRGRSAKRNFGVYSADNRRIGRIEAEFVEVTK